MTQKALTSLLIPCGITVIALSLGACQTSPTAMNAPPGMPVALESIEGAPDPVKSELSTALASAAAERKVELVSGTDARYRLKGYLTAYGRQDGSTELAFVWDVFDGDKRRAKRIEGTSFSTNASSSDAWNAVDQTTINKVASTSMMEVAGFLATDGRTATPATTTATASSATAVLASTESAPSAPGGGAALGFAE